MKVMKNVYVMMMLAFSAMITAQTGMGTPTPRGALDINQPTTNTLGLVLPTNDNPANMINPQGGTIAEGTIMYDSADKCLKFFDGTDWSGCAEADLPVIPFSVDCSTLGFGGIFADGRVLSGATFKVTITNNRKRAAVSLNFAATDLNLTGISGISVSSVAPVTTTLNPGKSVTITYNLKGTPAGRGTLRANWACKTLSCTSSISVARGPVRIAICGFTGMDDNNFEAQLNNPENYGISGTCKKAIGFEISRIRDEILYLSGEELARKYDIISIGQLLRFKNDFKIINEKIKAYADDGGVVFVNLANSNFSSDIAKKFGFRGSLRYGKLKAVTTTNHPINSGVFGNATNVSLEVDDYFDSALLTDNILPPYSRVLATSGNQPRVVITEFAQNVIFFWQDGVHSMNVSQGKTISTPQDIFFHNLMAHALDRIRQ